jgi:aryl-alcohol dehydrogenase-like predicted oxidoreductase
MKLVEFGKTELRVSELGVGCARIGGFFSKETPDAVALLHAARDAGINFFDTADMYSQGESEKLVGKAFQRQRDRVVIATKAGYRLPAQRRLLSRIKPLLRPIVHRLGLKRERLPSLVKGTITQDFSPAYLTAAVEGSLRRLKTDYVDLLQLHSPPAEIVEQGLWVDALDRLKRSGKIRYYGISVDSIAAGLAALRFPGVSSLQFAINLLDQAPSERLLPEANAKGVAAIARECLANGLLVKPANEIDLEKFCSSPEERRTKSEQLAKYQAAALAEGRPIASLALRYVQGLPGVSTSLIGVRTPSQLYGLLRAFES